MNSYRTLAIAALAFSAFAAQADSAVPRDGDWNSYPLTNQTHSSLTREAVVADLVAHAERVRLAEVERSLARVGATTERERALVEATTAAIVKKLHDAFKKAYDDPKVAELYEKFDFTRRYMNTEDYAAFAPKLAADEKDALEKLGLAKKE